MKRLSLDPDPDMAWIYDGNNPASKSDQAEDLRERRARAIQSSPRWMLLDALLNDHLRDAAHGEDSKETK